MSNTSLGTDRHVNPLCFGGDRVPQSLLTPDCQVCGGGGEKQEEIIQGTS